MKIPPPARTVSMAPPIGFPPYHMKSQNWEHIGLVTICFFYVLASFYYHIVFVIASDCVDAGIFDFSPNTMWFSGIIPSASMIYRTI